MASLRIVTSIAGSLKAFLFPVHTNNKACSYMESSPARKTILIDGEKHDLVFHPKKEAGDRINLSLKDSSGKMYNRYIDNTELANLARNAKNSQLVFVTMKDRLPKEADKAKEAYEARKAEVAAKQEKKQAKPKAPKSPAVKQEAKSNTPTPPAKDTPTDQPQPSA